MRRKGMSFARAHIGFALFALASILLGLGTSLLAGLSRPSTLTVILAPPATRCHARGLLPDPQCTPGATNPNVTQAAIRATICTPGWTRTIRPSVSYTDRLKIQQIRQYGYPDINPADYEEDHDIPLELGGAPANPRNLWPEAHPGSLSKDRVENLLRRRVCAGQLALTAAQRQIAADWTTVRQPRR